MLLESRGYIGTRDDLVTEYPTRETLYAEYPKKTDIREMWTEDGYRIINTAAPESGKIEYKSGHTTVVIESHYVAEMYDLIRYQPCPAVEELEVLRMIRGLSGGFMESIHLFQYGVMVGKHVERKRRQLEARKP